MVNLRYHVVSLIAVFLALALGVVLGAGPLQNQIKSISDGDNVQQRLTTAENELKSAQEVGEQYGSYVDAIAQEVLPGTLEQEKVAIVSMPGAAQESVDQIVAALQLSDAIVIGNVELTENWISYGQREYRDTLSAPVASHLQDKAASETADAVLSQALIEVLTLSGSEPDLLRQILTDETTPLVLPGTLPEKTATAAILVGPDGALVAAQDTEADESDAGVNVQAVLAVTDALASLPGGAVAVGAAADETDFISQLRSLGTSIATVDQLGSQMAPLNTALALAAGGTGSFGQGLDAAEPAAPLSTK